MKTLFMLFLAVFSFTNVSVAQKSVHKKGGVNFYDKMVNYLLEHKEVIGLLQRRNMSARFEGLVFQLSKKWHHIRLIDKRCMHQNWDCIWC